MSKHVYFIEAGKGGPIKIGVAANVDVRLRELQVGNASQLRIIVAVPGSHQDENRLHRRFKAERTSGEWFKAKGLVRDFAASLVAMTPEERVAAVAIESPKKPRRNYEKRKPGSLLSQYSPKQLYEMFYVGDGADVYRSAEADKALTEELRRRRAWGLDPRNDPRLP
jgi:hypothetical protein